MSNFALTKASAAALGLLCRTAGTDQLLLIQPARELRAEITVEPTGTADHGQIDAVLHLREQRHSITLQRDDGANAQHLAEWVEAAANGTLDTATAIPQRPCSCPSGDGTLRWPCKAHEAPAPAQGDLLPDEMHQMAFEEGQPAEDGDGYLFTAEEFDLFLERLLSRATRPAQTEQQSMTAPEGWQLVPVEPTPEMREAFHEATERYEDGFGESPDSQWQAMLRAAQATRPAA